MKGHGDHILKSDFNRHSGETSKLIIIYVAGVKEEFPNAVPAACKRFALNIRRNKFADPRVRRALNFAFDFEEMNRQIFFDQYKRISSYFDGTELASSGLPQGRELEILETVRAQVPRKYSRRSIPIRSAATPKPCGTICARHCVC